MSEKGVLDSIVHLAEGGVALVVEGAVGQLEGQQEVPDLSVAPVKQGEHPVELGPAGTALADGLEISRPGVTPAVAQDDPAHALAVDELLDLRLEVG